MRSDTIEEKTTPANLKKDKTMQIEAPENSYIEEAKILRKKLTPSQKKIAEHFGKNHQKKASFSAPLKALLKQYGYGWSQLSGRQKDGSPEIFGGPDGKGKPCPG